MNRPVLFECNDRLSDILSGRLPCADPGELSRCFTEISLLIAWAIRRTERDMRAERIEKAAERSRN